MSLSRYDAWKTAHPSWYEDDPCTCGRCGDEIGYDIHEDAPEDPICAACDESDDDGDDDWSDLFGDDMTGAATHQGGGR